VPTRLTLVKQRLSHWPLTQWNVLTRDKVPGRLAQVGKWPIDAGRSKARNSQQAAEAQAGRPQEPDAGTARG